MKNVTKVLRQLFGSNDLRTKDSYLQWAKIEYGADWRYAYDHMVANHGAKPLAYNKNLKGWV